MGLSVIIITKNEAQDLPRAINSVAFADEVIILDSGSTDGTQEIAKGLGAKVFQTDDWPGFGPQKNRALDLASQDWVLSLDADEWLVPELAAEIKNIVTNGGSTAATLQGLEQDEPVAYRIRRRSIFIDRFMRFGDWRRDHVVRLFRRGQARFTEDLVHERLLPHGQTRTLRGVLQHNAILSVRDSQEKMWHYNRIAAHKIANQGRGGLIKGLLKAFFSLFRGLILRGGILDGFRGLQLAWYNAYGTYIRYSLARSIQDERSYQSGKQSPAQNFRDFLHLFFIDHGFLRTFYDNRFRLAGGLYRINQPSPRRLAHYRRRYGIKTVINLRGKNDQLGWYRLEERACEMLGLSLVNIQVYSRGLVDAECMRKLEGIIRNIELPAVVHCKSGADRAGFFSVLYRHFRLGEPIEEASKELALKYGHLKSAKTGILDYFFLNFLTTRHPRQSFVDWTLCCFDRETLQVEFRPFGLADWVVDRLFRRE